MLLLNSLMHLILSLIDLILVLDFPLTDLQILLRIIGR